MRLTSAENAQVETHGVVLVGDEEEEAVAHNGPDHDIGQDPGRQRLCIDGSSTDGEKKNVVEGQRTGDHGDMDESWGSRVLEVEG